MCGKVSVVKTESIGEARGLMEVMDNCDAVVIAGGDGAVAEAITGLLRRQDSDYAVQRFPIGIIPVGALNNVAKSIFKQYKGICTTFSMCYNITYIRVILIVFRR